MAAEGGHLSAEGGDGPIYIRYMQGRTGVAQQVACGGIVASVDDDVIAADDSVGILRGQLDGVFLGLYFGIQCLQAACSTADLGLSHLRLCV